MNLTQKHSFKYGFLILVGLIAYFLIMKAIGLEDNLYLRIFNFIIMAGGVWMAQSTYFKNKADSFSYFSGLGVGFIASVVAVIGFVIFMSIYIYLIDPSFIEVMKNSEMWTQDVTPGTAAFAVAIEGIVSGAIISFIGMQYFKSTTFRKKMNDSDL
ncbi:DUF4199 domain-containing protein [Halocola ammonii]